MGVEGIYIYNKVNQIKRNYVVSQFESNIIHEISDVIKGWELK